MYVQVGQENEEYVEIIPNLDNTLLNEGDIVLTAGHTSLVHDARVRLTDNAKRAGGRPQ